MEHHGLSEEVNEMTHHDTDDMRLKIVDEGDTPHVDQHFEDPQTCEECGHYLKEEGHAEDCPYLDPTDD